ncbi:MAG: cytochrome c nitrite reductase small subunit [Bacteroidales bacterium]|nr:cytochrome c nitrite reductase small subunit [Bacteroidales bacterium]
MNFIKKFYPPEQWRVPVIILLGIIVGLGAYMIHISRAPSYLSDAPETCINCHVMVPQYSTWIHSSHREETNCNDCHVPHDNFFNHYYFKAKDGLRHATIFTLRNEPQSIKIKHAGVIVVQENCIRCHENLIEGGTLGNYSPGLVELRKERLCWDCHQNVPHGDVRSLSSTANTIVPLPESPVPQWLRKAKKDN